MSTRESWTSRIGFILATAGFAIGFGNIWRFPYVAGSNGGGAFLLVYIVAIFIVAIPLLALELGLGRKAQSDPIHGMQALEGKKSIWQIIGWSGTLFQFIAVAVYMTIPGWILAYICFNITGVFNGMETHEVAAYFDNFVASPGYVLLFVTIVVVITWFVVSKNLRDGIEKYSCILLPILFLFLVVLAVRSLTLPGAMEGVRWFLKPDFSLVTVEVAIEAVGQLFFSVGIGMAVAFLYGSYMNKNSSILSGAAQVVFLDTLAAIIVGIVIFPAVFAYGLPPDSGPNLLFITMSAVFAKMPLGQLFGTLFFILTFFAALTTSFGSVEVVAKTFQNTQKNMSKLKATTIVCIVLWCLGAPLTFAYTGNLAAVRILGRNIFEFADYISINWILMLGAITLVLYVPLKWGWWTFKDDINMGEHTFLRIKDWMIPLYYVVYPLFLILLMLAMLGVENPTIYLIIALLIIAYRSKDTLFKKKADIETPTRV